MEGRKDRKKEICSGQRSEVLYLLDPLQNVGVKSSNAPTINAGPTLNFTLHSWVPVAASGWFHYQQGFPLCFDARVNQRLWLDCSVSQRC